MGNVGVVTEGIALWILTQVSSVFKKIAFTQVPHIQVTLC